jgi:hypothetical protein
VSSVPNSLAVQYASAANSPAPASFSQVNSAPVAHDPMISSSIDEFLQDAASSIEKSSNDDVEEEVDFCDYDQVDSPSYNIQRMPSALSTTTFNSLKAAETVGPDYGDAPGVPAVPTQSSARDSCSQRTESDHSRVSTIKFECEGGRSQRSSTNLEPKKMKTTSKASQFYTTIVVKCCCHVKEYYGFIPTHRRNSIIFRKVECALRDRKLYPLPADVKLKDLMAFSFFQGPDEDADFKKYCDSGSANATLTEEMTTSADRLFNNKFADVRKIISNGIIQKFGAIVKKITGNGKKSGQGSQHSFVFLHLLKHFSGTTIDPKILWKMQTKNCMR